jgi:hypothetical protein
VKQASYPNALDLFSLETSRFKLSSLEANREFLRRMFPSVFSYTFLIVWHVTCTTATPIELLYKFND